MKKNRLRRNVAKKSDMDYWDKLNKEQKEFMLTFENEFYCNAHGKNGSLHRKALGKEYDSKVKSEMYLQHNAENRDLYAIAESVEFLVQYSDIIDSTINERVSANEKLLKTIPPKEVLQIKMKEVLDDIIFSQDNEEEMKSIILEYTNTILALYTAVINKDRKDKTNKANKRRSDKIKEVRI